MSDRVLIRLETREERDALLRTLRGRQIEPDPEGETSLAVDVQRGSPGVAAVVAAVERWRPGCCEVVLELGERKTVLRTET